MIGTRGDGTPHHMCGVILFGVRDDLANWSRFYLEPVNTLDMTIIDEVRNQVRS